MLFLVYYLTRVVLLQLVYKIMSFHNIAYGNIQDYKKMHNATKRTIVSNNVFSRWTETRTLSKTNLFQGIAFILILMTSEIIISNEKVNYINKWLFSVIPVIISESLEMQWRVWVLLCVYQHSYFHISDRSTRPCNTAKYGRKRSYMESVTVDLGILDDKNGVDSGSMSIVSRRSIM